MNPFKRFTIVAGFAAIALTALVAPQSALAGRAGGPGVTRDRVDAHDTERYTATFHGDELAVVTVDGDGDTDLDLYVYDENGNLVASDTGSTDRCVVSWSPRWTGPFTVVVRNRGGVYNRFTLLTN